MSCIYIIPIHTDPAHWSESLDNGILKTYGVNTRYISSAVNLPETFDSYRRQYNSSRILVQLIQSPPSDALKVLGITEVDMFIPVLTFVFGEAQLDGIGAVVSLHRLNNKFYGLPEDNRLLTERLVKEAIHELGHTFGLVHCSNPACVLISSTYVEDIDQKTGELCAQCRQYLAAKQGLPPRL